MYQPIPDHDDGPAYAEFDMQRGDTASIGVVLLKQDIFTQETRIYDLTGKTAYWIIVLPGGQQVASTAPGSDLVFEQATGVLIHPFTAAFTAALPSDPVRTVVRIQDDTSGEITTWVDGYIVPRG